MLVGLALLALISGMVASNLNMSAKTMVRVDGRTEKLGVTSRQQFLLELFERITSAPSNSLGQRNTGFVGQENSVRFVANLPSWLPRSGPVAMQLQLSPISSDRLYDLQIVLDDAEIDDPEYATHTIVEKITDVSFRYFGRSESTRESAWQESFDQKDALPKLVEILVSFPSGDQRRWPKTIARVSPL